MSSDQNSNSNKNQNSNDDQNNKNDKAYNFGGIKEYNLEQIETEVLSESIYLDVFAGSDLRLKTDVTEVFSALDSIKKLDAISYRWNPEIKNQLTEGDSNDMQTGLVAQQVAEVFPELVRKDEATGFLAINYSRLTTHLLVAIKEISQQLDIQNNKIAALEDQIKTLRN